MRSTDLGDRTAALLEHAHGCAHGLSTRSTEVALAHAHAAASAATEARTANLLTLLGHLGARPEYAAAYRAVLAAAAARLDIEVGDPC